MFVNCFSKTGGEVTPKNFFGHIDRGLCGQIRHGIWPKSACGGEFRMQKYANARERAKNGKRRTKKVTK